MQWGPDRPAPKVFFVSEMRQWLDARRISLHEGFYSMVQRSTIGLSSRHREILESLYLEFRIPSDQYQRRQQDLTRLVRRWNILTDRGDSPSQVLHYIITKRKNGDWVRLDGEHKRLKTMPEDFLSTEEWEILQDVYDKRVLNQGVGTDALAYDDDLARQIQREFSQRAGRAVRGSLLVAAIIAKRKRGEWTKLRPGTDTNGHAGSQDSDDIVG